MSPDPMPASTCPICGRSVPPAAPRPFCSTRCADVDLGRWFTGQYRVAAPDPDAEPEVDPADEPG